MMQQRLIILLSIFFLMTCGDSSSNAPTASENIQAPSVEDIALSIDEDVTKKITLTGSDPQGRALGYSIVAQPKYGTIVMNNSIATYTPNQDYNGNDTFTYQATNQVIESDIGTVSLSISPVADPPTVHDVSVEINEDGIINIALQCKDPDAEQSFTYAIVDNPTNGSVTINGATATYTSNLNWSGTDTFTYKSNDGTFDSNTGTVTTVIAAVDDDPNTVDIVVTTDEDTPIDITLSAEEYDGDSYSFSVVSETTNGTLSLNGSVATYTPNLNWYGTDSFTFQALDDRSIMNIATATIAVNPVNDAPNSEPITVELIEDNGGNGIWSGLYVFSDVEGDVITCSIDPSTANPGINAGFRFQLKDSWFLDIDPIGDYAGTHVYTYTASDGIDTSTSTITVIVTAHNEPQIEDISVFRNIEDIDPNTAITLEIDLSSHVTSSEVPLSDLTYNIGGWDFTSSITGSLLTIEIPAGYQGSKQTNWYVNDGIENSENAFIECIVDCPGVKPSIISDITLTIPTNTSTQIDFADYVSNPSNLDLTYGGAQGDNVLGWGFPYTIEGSILTITPETDWIGFDNANWVVRQSCWSTGIELISLINITVECAGEKPSIISDITLTIPKNTSTQIDLADSVTNPSNLDLTYALLGWGFPYTIEGSVLTITPPTDFTGFDNTNWVVRDDCWSTGNELISLINITVE